MQSDCNNDSVAATRTTFSPKAEGGREVSPARRAWLDRLGVGVSITCAIHCMAAALLAAAPAFAAGTAPALGEGLESLETGLLWIALGIGTFALLPSYLREHRNPVPLALFALGIGVIALMRGLDSHIAEIAGTVSGVALVASAHLVNLRSRGRLHAHAHSH